MKSPKTLTLVVVALGLCGGALLIVLLARHGFGAVATSVAAAGWGVALVILFHLVPMFFDTIGWRAVIPPENRLNLGNLYLMRWIGDSVSAMLPVAQVGGEIVRVRLATVRGMPLPIAAGSVIVAITISVATQIIFTLTGLGLLIVTTGHGGSTRSIIVGTVTAVLAVGGFYAVQRVGIFRLMGVIVSHLSKSEAFQSLVARGEELDRAVRQLYTRSSALLESGVWNMCVWATGAVEVWIALRALGMHATYTQSYIIESASQGIRSVMFLVPGALGVQEGGFLVVGSLLGVSAETALALAMIRRARELAFGLPGLVAWQFVEGRRWLSRQSSSDVVASAGATERDSAPVEVSRGVD